MKYDRETKRVIRDAADKERHREVRDRLQFPSPPSINVVRDTVDSLVVEGLLPPDKIDRELSETIRALRLERERRGLSLADLSAKSGLQEDDLSELEAGLRKEASLQELRAWAEALGKHLCLTLSDA